MKILVTGGAGFIGSQVADRYLADGHQVVIVDNLSTGKEAQVNPRAVFHHMDIRDPQIKNMILRERPAVINHHAAQLDVRKSVADPLFDAQTNILGMLNLLEGAVEAGVQKFIFASSGGAIYGEQSPTSPPAREDTPLYPLSPYGVAKAAGELYLHAYGAVHGLPYVALRYCNVYGPRQDPYGEAGVVAIFIGQLMTGGKVLINGDGLQTRDYVFVADVVEANALALQAAVSGSFNIGTGVENTVNDLFALLLEITGKIAPEVHGPAKAGEQRRSVLDNQKAKKDLGWEPQIPFAEGLRRTVQYFAQKLSSSS